MSFRLCHLALLAAALLPCAAADKPAAGTDRPASPGSQPAVVKVVKKGAGYALWRDGAPYFIKGVGGDGSLKALAAAGGNSVRTWDFANAGPVLDEAHRRGLTVAVGIWLGHERHGFNYRDAAQVAAQRRRARSAVLKFKDHPALLLWGVGNEMEGDGEGDRAAVWSAVNDVARLAKKLDPNHPTMTVIAEVGGDKVRELHRLCPDVDVVGVNSYGGAATLPRRYREAGGTRPFILTEFGPPGPWEVKKTAWGAPLEPSSTAKAASYRDAYTAAVAPGGPCLGSYAFLWGHKQEATATWFGMLLPDGSRLAAVDALTERWTGKAPANRCPVITALTLDGPDEVEPGAAVRARLTASAPDGGRVAVTWVLQSDPAARGAGGDREAAPPTHPRAVVKADARGATLRAPAAAGAYRLFAYARDGIGGAAVANAPLRVKGPAVAPAARAARLPLIIYDESDRKNPPYAPTGWMGATAAVRLKPDCPDRPHAGKTCLRVDYADKGAWAGVAWQDPANDWGDRAGGWDLRGARKLTFWARGAAGGEVVTFETGILGGDKRFPDSARARLERVKLTAQWKQYAIDLAGKDLSRIKSGFACTWAGQGKPLTFYLDDVRFE